MESALRKRLILSAFLPLLLLTVILLAVLWLSLAYAPFSVWVVATGVETQIVLATLVVAAVFVLVELVMLMRVARIAGGGTRGLLKVTETARFSQGEVPRSLSEDVEFSVLAKRLEQLSRGAKGEAASAKRLVQLEEELERVANAIEEVSVGSPFVPLPEKEGTAGRIASLLNKLLPEFCELRTSSVREIRGMEAVLQESKTASQELAAHAEKSFVESTEALVVAREVSKLASETREKLKVLAGKPREVERATRPREEIRDAVTKVVETAARGIEGLTEGLLKSSALSRSSERIANRASVLALNVAVEAAKASMPGMNVLSEEIRKLAEFARACSDENAALVRAIETKVDSVVRTIHISQEEVRLRMRSLGLPEPEEETAGEQAGARAELDRVTQRLGDAAERLLDRVQALSKLTEKASREAERVSRRALAAHDQTKALVKGESWKSPSVEAEPTEVETLSENDFLAEDNAAEKQEGD
ncbi:MAG: methyl-accepting chemotaxis protein [Candidatus Eiseniibacteriota bacterium]|nr:MAG: methyl-accepting chemotaxis protein [Candidatus Eisenbacteria bacterium]